MDIVLLSISSIIFHVLNTSTRLVGQFVQLKLTQKRKKGTNVCMLCSQIGSATPFKMALNFDFVIYISNTFLTLGFLVGPQKSSKSMLLYLYLYRLF